MGPTLTLVRFCRENDATQGYRVSQRIRKRVEEIFGWMKSYGGLRKTRFRGAVRTQQTAHFVGAAYNMLRIANLMAGAE